MTSTAPQTYSYTNTDVEAVVRRITADLVMIAISSGAETEETARKWAHDIELLAKNGYLKTVDVTLLSYGVEKQAVRYSVDETGGLSNDRPGNARWPKVTGAVLRIVLSYTSAYTQSAREKMADRMKTGWSPSYADTSHSTLSKSGGREYSSNNFGMQREDYC